MRTLFGIIMLITVAVAVHAGEGPAVNYVSADAIYLNVGREAGLAIGATVTVYRDGKRIATLEVVHVSSHSASCRIVEQSDAPRAGDMVLFEPVRAPPPLASPPPERPAVAPTSSPPRERNRLSGYVSLESMVQRDLAGTGFTSYQPGLRARVTVDRLWGTGARLLLRHSSRAYHRSTPTESRTDWTHRLTELAIVGGDLSGVAYGVGRVLVPDLYGLGYVDGAYVSTALPGKFRVGVAGGLDPDFLGAETEWNRRKVGAFATYSDRYREHTTLSVTGAASGSYADGVISREFGYLQVVLGAAQRYHLYQSMEIDFNRGWRRDAAGDAVTISNLIIRGSAEVTPFVTIDAGYDERQNFHDIDTYQTPDSLFDDRAYSGYRLGATLRFPRGVRLGASGGLRYRDGESQSNRFLSVRLSAPGLPRRGHGITAQLSISRTPYLTGYRPTLLYRFPVTRSFRASAGTGAYLYRATGVETDTVFLEAGGYLDFATRYFLSGNLREYFGGGLESITGALEVGVNF